MGSPDVRTDDSSSESAASAPRGERRLPSSALAPQGLATVVSAFQAAAVLSVMPTALKFATVTRPPHEEAVCSELMSAHRVARKLLATRPER